MARKSRIDAPGALHHIIIRGIEGRSIFADTLDYQNFLERLSDLLTDASTPCYAWALMPNHAHFLLRTGAVPISTVMRKRIRAGEGTWRVRAPSSALQPSTTQDKAARMWPGC